MSIAPRAQQFVVQHRQEVAPVRHARQLVSMGQPLQLFLGRQQFQLDLFLAGNVGAQHHQLAAGMHLLGQQQPTAVDQVDLEGAEARRAVLAIDQGQPVRQGRGLDARAGALHVDVFHQVGIAAADHRLPGKTEHAGKGGIVKQEQVQRVEHGNAIFAQDDIAHEQVGQGGIGHRIHGGSGGWCQHSPAVPKLSMKQVVQMKEESCRVIKASCCDATMAMLFQVSPDLKTLPAPLVAGFFLLQRGRATMLKRNSIWSCTASAPPISE